MATEDWTVKRSEDAEGGAAEDAPETEWTWDGIHALMASWAKDQEGAKAAERARVMSMAPDGKTLHFFNRLPSLEWDYGTYDADVLIDWATAVVLARQSPALLGTLH